MKKLIHLFLVVVLFSCSQKDAEKSTSTLFAEVPTQVSSVDFTNALTETDSLNYFNYQYIYMGGGVSIADFNNDGLSDLYFTGNMVANKLYLNKGKLAFEDITNDSNTAGDSRWMHGTTVCDINSDGWLDIYVSVSGKSEICKNILFVNQGLNSQGIPVFRDEAEKYGLDDPGHSINSTFFDYDNDGDLDLYVANYPITYFKEPLFYYEQMLARPEMVHSDHLYENLGEGYFKNVTKEAGILNFGLALSATVTDFNNDGFKDLYVSNDFASPDFFYLNNGDGTFSEMANEVTSQTSFYGMGVDLADFNNDGLMDVVQVDMSPEDNRRSKENMASMNPEGFYEMINRGLHYQYMYNSLQLNRGLDENGYPVFSNMAWMAGLQSTDWSWSPLFADFDNDGWKDVFISNGTRRDISNKDYFKKIDTKNLYFSQGDEIDQDQLEKVEKMPSESIANYIYKNNGGITFTNSTEEWGLSKKSFSNGAVYSDLDNDGDLDLVINNIDEPAFIFKNNSIETKNTKYLKIDFDGPEQNKLGLGTKVKLWSNGLTQIAELTLTRGYQSSTDPTLHFGLAQTSIVDSLEAIWTNGKKQKLTGIPANQKLTIKYSEASSSTNTIEQKVSPLFSEYKTNEIFSHQENEFDDFKYQVLLPHKMSNFGPGLAKGDVNNDGLDDLYLGGALGYAGKLLIQKPDGSFSEQVLTGSDEKMYEDLDAQFLDIDNDNDLDLYVVSGGNELQEGSAGYSDRLYLNTNGTFEYNATILPEIASSGSSVKPFDYDNDGDLDLFIGGRLNPRNYPLPGDSYLLESNVAQGNISFTDVTESMAPDLKNVGMVTDAIWTDVNDDGKFDLLVVGEWMGISVFENLGNGFSVASEKYFSGNTTGWWFSVEEADFDNDGDKDLILGNLGLNYKYQAAPDATFNLYSNDFDENGHRDIVLAYHNFGVEFPVRGKQCSSEQIPALKERFKDYSSFSTANVEEIFGENNLETALTFRVESFASVYAEKQDDGTYTLKKLPTLAQLSPINDILIDDFNEDGNLDVVTVGNLYASEVETPRADAGIGLLLLGDGNGNFTSLDMNKSGIYIPHDSKKISAISIGSKSGFVVANNNGPLKFYAVSDKALNKKLLADK